MLCEDSFGSNNILNIIQAFLWWFPRNQYLELHNTSKELNNYLFWLAFNTLIFHFNNLIINLFYHSTNKWKIWPIERLLMFSNGFSYHQTLLPFCDYRCVTDKIRQVSLNRVYKKRQWSLHLETSQLICSALVSIWFGLYMRGYWSLMVYHNNFIVWSVYSCFQTICDALHDLFPYIQFNKRKKYPWRSVTFSKIAGWSLQLH